MTQINKIAIETLTGIKDATLISHPDFAINRSVEVAAAVGRVMKTGEPYRLIALPMARPAFEDDERIPATYANYLVINGAVLVPTYDTDLDAIALSQVQQAFPEHEIVGIDCQALIRQHGSLHCVTMQYPS